MKEKTIEKFEKEVNLDIQKLEELIDSNNYENAIEIADMIEGKINEFIDMTI